MNYESDKELKEIHGDKKIPDYDYTREQRLEDLHRFSVPHKEVMRLFDELREQEECQKSSQISTTKTNEGYNLDDYPTLRGFI